MSMPTDHTSPAPSFTRRWRRLLLIAVCAAALWTGLGAFLPGWLRPRVEALASETLGTPVTMARLRVQPWTGVVGIEALSIGPAAAPLLRLEQAEAQLSLESVWRLAPVLRRLTLVKPDVWIERQSAWRFNFTPIIEKLMAPPEPAKADEAPQRFALFNIVLRDGSVRYTDRVLAQTHLVDHVRIGVPFLSNLPSYVRVDVQPEVSARVDGSLLHVKGRTLPFDEGLKSELDLRLDAVDLPRWIAALHPFLPAEWRPVARGGTLDTALAVGFEMRKPPAVPLLSVKGRVQVDKLDVALDKSPMLGDAALDWHSLKVEGIDAAPLERRLVLGKVDLDGLTWRSALLAGGARRDGGSAAARDGHVDADGRVGGRQDKTTPASTAAWHWRVDQLSVRTGRIDVQPVLRPAAKPGFIEGDGEAGQSPAPWPRLDKVLLSAKGLSSRPDAKPASWQFELHDEHQAALLAQGQAQVAERTFSAELNLSRLKLGPWLAPLSPLMKPPLTLVQGELAVQARLDARLAATPVRAPTSTSEATEAAGEKPQARLLAGRLQLKGIEAQASQRGLKDAVRLDTLTLDGIQALVALDGERPVLRQALAEALEIVRLDAALTRGTRGEWLGMAPSAMQAPSAMPASSKVGKPGMATVDASPDLSLKTLRCEACQLRLTDQTVSPPARFDVTEAMLTMAGLSGKLANPIEVKLDTLAQGKGRVRFDGQVRPEPLSVQGRVQVAGLDLRAAQPYIDPLVNVTLAAARAQADGQLTLQDKGRAGLSARYKGRAGLSDLRMQDRVNDADFLRWQALSLDALDINWADGALDADLGRIALKDFYGRLIINPGGQLNLTGIMRQQAGGETRSLTTPEAAKGVSPTTATTSTSGSGSPASAAFAKPSPKLRWQHIELARGRIDFTDNFIKPNYSARLTQIEGEVSAVSSLKPEPATIRVAGAVDDAAPLLITGRLHPLGPRLYTDIEGSAKGIELTRLTPYAARYAGYAIEKGSLSVTVHYKVDGGKLEASNQIFLDQLTFGEKTDSPDAVNLPVQLAVSLLKNGKGEIDVNLPISGSLDDPAFSVGGIIWRVIVNLVTKAITAPFSLLAGGGSDELGLVPFDAGSARLGEAATQRLDALAARLQDRPALKLEATGRADPALDIEGLRRAHVNRLMRIAKAKATSEPQAEVRIDDKERLTWLKAAYKEADIKKPRNLIGLPKDIGADEMEALLKASATVDDEALRTLANRRGDVVKAYLAGKLPPERVLLTASKIGKEGLPDDKEPTTRVQFSVR